MLTNLIHAIWLEDSERKWEVKHGWKRRLMLKLSRLEGRQSKIYKAKARLPES